MLLFINIDNLVEVANKCTALQSPCLDQYMPMQQKSLQSAFLCFQNQILCNWIRTIQFEHSFPSHLKIKGKVSFISWGIALFPTLAYNIQHSFNKQVHFLKKDSSRCNVLCGTPTKQCRQNGAGKTAQINWCRQNGDCIRAIAFNLNLWIFHRGYVIMSMFNNN